MTAALQLIDIAVDIDGRRVVHGVDLVVSPGEVVGILGANGCGKTTLLRAALGLARAVRGVANLSDTPVSRLNAVDRARLVAYLPQERRVGWNLPAWRVAALGAPHLPADRARDVALAALADVEMAHLAERGARDMSGGERARVLLARLLVTGAPLLVADEPAAGLDPDAQLLAMNLLRARATSGTAVLVTLHDLTLAAQSCDRLLVMARGRAVAQGRPHDVLTPKILSDAFGLRGRITDVEGLPVVTGQRRSPRGG